MFVVPSKCSLKSYQDTEDFAAPGFTDDAEVPNAAIERVGRLHSPLDV